MSKPVKSGKTLETLVTYIEKALANKEQVTVDTRKRLPDRTTGRLREHDVVLTLTQGHHEIVIAIECRDLSRRITVNQVESFWAKCQHTGVAHGIMVSSKGFYRSARQKATHLGIRCLDLEEAAAFDWLVGQGITVGYRMLKHSHWTYLLERVPEGSIAEFRLVTTEGEEILPDVLQANLVRRHTEPVDMPFLLIPRSLLRGGFIFGAMVCSLSTRRLESALLCASLSQMQSSKLQQNLRPLTWSDMPTTLRASSLQTLLLLLWVLNISLGS